MKKIFNINVLFITILLFLVCLTSCDTGFEVVYLNENGEILKQLKLEESTIIEEIDYTLNNQDDSFLYWTSNDKDAFNFEKEVNTSITLKPVVEKKREIELSNNNEVNSYTLEEEVKSFNFFWDTQQKEGTKGAGLIPDRYPSNGLASIASVGWGLSAFAIGVQNEWITFEEGKARSIMTLENMKNLKRVNGFYYHFYYEKNGRPAAGSEVSGIDTAIFIIGALSAGEYFGGEVKTLAYDIYNEINWNWYVNPKTNQFYMSYKNDAHSGKWDTYGEQLMMYFLGSGAPKEEFRTGKNVYDSFRRYKGKYTSKNGTKFEYINSWFGSIFTYQFSHAFIDFRNIVDADGIDWFENSITATKCARQYCIDNPENFSTVTHNKNSWGLTACDTPSGYSGLLGSNPTGFGHNDQTRNDGTVALCGSVGSIPFLPEEVQESIEYYYTFDNRVLVGEFGLLDAYNNENNLWVANDVIGIDKGISVVMIENYRTGLIWDCLFDSNFMNRAIEVLEYEKTN